MVSQASRSCGYLTKTPLQQTHTPSILYATLLGVWCLCTLALHLYFWALGLDGQCPLYRFIRGLLLVLGGYHFLKTPIRFIYHKRLQLIPVGIQRTAQHLFEHFRVCVFVTMGLEICSQCSLLTMAAVKNRDMELAV
jgi:hypothetical protein